MELQPLFELAARQHGLVGRRQALDLGTTPAQLDGLVRFGRLDVVARGVYRAPGSPPSGEQRLLALILAAGPGAHAAGRSAAWVQGIPGFAMGAEVVVPRGRSRRRAGLRDTRFLPSQHCEVVRAIPVTTIERTLFDLATRVAPERLDALLRWAVRKKRTTPARLHVCLAETAVQGRAGSGPLRPALSALDEGFAVTDSELEDLALAVLRGAALPAPRTQVELGDADGRIGRVDLYYEDARLVIEADSDQEHGTWLARQEDIRRDLRLRAAGFTVIRVTWELLTRRPEEFLAAVRACLRAAA